MLGDLEYGIWILVVSLVGYMEVLNVGLNTASVRYLTEYFERKEHQNANEIFNAALFIFLILGMVIVIGVLGLSPFFGRMFGLVNYETRYASIFVIAGINLAFEFAFYPFSAILSARQKFVEANVISVTVFIMRSLVVVFLLFNGYKLLGVVLNQAVFNIVKGILLSAYALKTTPWLKVSRRYINISTIKSIAKLSKYLLVINLSRKVSLTSPYLLIALFGSPSGVSAFAIAGNLVTYFENFMSGMARVLMPRFSQLRAVNRGQTIREYYLSFTRIGLMLSIPVMFIFVFYGSSLIGLWVGQEYAEVSGLILAVLSVGTLCRVSQSTGHSVLKATDRQKALAYFVFFESVACVVLSLVLMMWYGLVGVAWGQAISMMLFNLVIVPVYVCRELKIGVGQFYGRYVFNNIFSLVPLLLGYYFVAGKTIDSIPMFGVASVMIIGAFLSCSYFLTLNMKERQILAAVVRVK